MKKRMLTVIMALVGVAAFADSTDGSGVYGGLGAGAAWNAAAYPAASFRADVGYNFNDNVALEAGTTGITQSGSGNNQSMQYYDLSVKGTLPLSDVFGVFGQFGGAYGSPGAVGSPQIGFNGGNLQAGWSFLTAAGLEMDVTRQVSFNLADYYYYGAPNPQGNTNAVLAGVKYNF